MSTTSIGNLSDNYISIDFAGKTDPTDTYRFDRLNPGSFRVTAEGFSSGIGMQLLDTQGKVVKDIATDGTNSGTFSIDNLGATNYALKISAPARDTNYQVSLTPDGKVDPLTGLGVTSGFFTTDSTGQVGFDWLHDGGNYQGEVAVFSVQGMEDFDPSSEDFIKESARRALSNSLFGHVVISDPIEGANPLFNGSLGEDNYNGGQYSGPKTFFMKPGEAFAVMLVPNGTVQDVFNNPGAGGDKRPLLSLSSLNPDDAFLSGQIADVTGKGKAFAMEDQRVDQGSDKDYNDLVFNLTGATGKAVSIDKVIDPNKDWTKLDGGKKLIDYVASKQPVPEPPVAVTPPVETTPPAATIPPVPTTPPVTVEPPAATIPPVPTIPPVTVEPPAATIPPVPTTPPVTVEPPAATIPPVETIPPVTVEPPAATIPPVETTPPVATIPPIEQKFPVERPIALAPPIESKLPVEPPAIEDMPQPIAPESPVEPDLPIIPPPEQRAFIGIIDTGFAPNNPDLDYSQVTLGRDRIDKDSNPLFAAGEGNEHGTFSWGLVSAIQGNDKGIDGYNDKANVYLSRAIGSGEWDLALTDFVGEAKAQKQKNAIALLPLDLTQKNADGSITTRYEFTPRERAALENARQSGVLLVVAAGNDGGVMSVLGQSSQEFENILTVGSSDGFGRSDYSSYGYGLDILVPGGAIDNPTLSTVGDDIGQMAGTSASAAIAAGMASKVWESNPDLNPTQIIDILTGSAIDLKEPGWDKETGFGVVNLNKAVEVAKDTKPQSYTPSPFITPTTWDGEGKVTPMERATQDWNAVGDGRRKYVGWLNSSNPSDKLSFTVNQAISNFQFGLKAPPQGSTSQYSGSTTTLYDSNGNAISTLSYNPSLPNEGLFGATPLNPGSYYVVLDKGSQSTIDPYEIVLNFTGLSGEVKPLDDTIYLPRPTVSPTPTPTPDPIVNPTPVTQPSSIILNGHTIAGDFYPVFQNYQGTLGNPTSDVINSNGVSYQVFDKGSIVSSKNGTFPLYGAIRQTYLKTGGLEGWLGVPKSGEKGLGNGNILQYFEHGYIYWNGSKATAYGEGSSLPSNNSGTSPVKPNSIPKLGNPNLGINPTNPNPINPKPTNPNPINPNPINPNPTNPKPINPNPTNPNPVNIKPTVNFDLKNQSLWGSGNSSDFNFGGSWKKESDPISIKGWGDFSVGAEFKAKAFLSKGIMDVSFPALFDISYANSANANTIAVTFKPTLTSQGKLQTNLGVGASFAGNAFAKFESVDLPFGLGKISPQIGASWEVSTDQILSGLISPVITDLTLEAKTSQMKNGKIKATDDAFWGVDVASILNKLHHKDFPMIGTLGVNVKQESFMEVKGFKIDYDDQQNGNEFEVGFNQLKTQNIPAGIKQLRVQPIVDLWTEFSFNLKTDAGISLSKSIDKLGLPDNVKKAVESLLPKAEVKLSAEKQIGESWNPIKTKFNPFKVANYWGKLNLT